MSGSTTSNEKHLIASSIYIDSLERDGREMLEEYNSFRDELLTKMTFPFEMTDGPNLRGKGNITTHRIMRSG